MLQNELTCVGNCTSVPTDALPLSQTQRAPVCLSLHQKRHSLKVQKQPDSIRNQSLLSVCLQSPLRGNLWIDLKELLKWRRTSQHPDIWRNNKAAHKLRLNCSQSMWKQHSFSRTLNWSLILRTLEFFFLMLYFLFFCFWIDVSFIFKKKKVSREIQMMSKNHSTCLPGWIMNRLALYRIVSLCITSSGRLWSSDVPRAQKNKCLTFHQCCLSQQKIKLRTKTTENTLDDWLN